MANLRSLTGLVVCVCLSGVAPARADVVSDWKAVTVLYVGGGPGTPPNPPLDVRARLDCSTSRSFISRSTTQCRRSKAGLSRTTIPTRLS